MPKVIIADDHKLVREGLRTMITALSSKVKVVGEAANGPQLLDLLTHTEAEIVLLDLDMPEMDGIEVALAVQQQFPLVNLLVLSMLKSEEYISQAIEVGVKGYLLKSVGANELIRAIEMVAEGERYIDSQITLNLLKKYPPIRTASRPVRPDKILTSNGVFTEAEAITPREMEVLRLLAKGYTSSQIAEITFTSTRTVETYRKNLLLKTGSVNTASLIHYAAINHLLD